MLKTKDDRSSSRRPGLSLSLLVAMALAMLVAAPGWSEDSLSPSARTPEKDSSAETRDPEPAEPAATVELDSLLKLPSDMSFQHQRRHGASAEEWKSRFRDSRESIGHAEAELARVKGELDEMAGSGGGGQWQVAPPGSNQTEVQPMSYKLREELRRTRERLDEAERAYRELQVEADLANVPEDWRGKES